VKLARFRELAQLRLLLVQKTNRNTYPTSLLEPFINHKPPSERKPELREHNLPNPLTYIKLVITVLLCLDCMVGHGTVPAVDMRSVQLT